MSIKAIYSCSKCDAQFPKWSGRCLQCGAWGTLEESVIEQKKDKLDSIMDKMGQANLIDLRELKAEKQPRLKTAWPEIDRVLGGGILNDSLLLLSGEPGIGKSTLSAQIAGFIGQKNPVLYVSGEESASQVKDRFERLNIDLEYIRFISETSVEKIISAASQVKPKLLIVDSVQTIYSTLLNSEAGNISQIRAVTVKLLELAKSKGISILLIGHITKDGQIAGPKSLEHIVDVVLSLEQEKGSNYSLLRASKNRFGSVNELGVLEMKSTGFIEVKDPGSIFLSDHLDSLPGSVVSCVLEGSRPFLVNIQALVSKTVFGYPQRKSSGLDLNRLQVLSAVIAKREKVDLSTKDIILNIVGGLKVNDPAVDLAVCGAIISSFLNKSLDPKTVLIGEVGLGGELRPVFRLEQRLNEAEKLGFKRALTFSKTKFDKKLKIELRQITSLRELMLYFK
jgi:DNA repair protein RadA/Sms